MTFKKCNQVSLLLLRSTTAMSLALAYWYSPSSLDSKEYSIGEYLRELPEDQFGEHDVYHVKEEQKGCAISGSFSTFHKTLWSDDPISYRYCDKKFWGGSYLDSYGWPVFERDTQFKWKSGYPAFVEYDVTIQFRGTALTLKYKSREGITIDEYCNINEADYTKSVGYRRYYDKDGNVIAESPYCPFYIDYFNVDAIPGSDFPDPEDFGRKYAISPTFTSEHYRYLAVRQAINSLDERAPNWYEAIGGMSSVKELTSHMAKTGNLMVSCMDTKGPKLKNLAQLWSDLFLTKRYEIDGSASDYRSVRDSLKSLRRLIDQQQITQYGKITDDQGRLVRAAVYCTPLDNGLFWDDMIGITPSPSNLWAAIPFTFMVDWFLKGGENLSEIEFAYKYGSDYWNISHVVYSVKEFRELNISFPGWITLSNPVFKLYSRESRRSLPNYEFERPDDPDLKNHVLEGTAIALNAF